MKTKETLRSDFFKVWRSNNNRSDAIHQIKRNFWYYLRTNNIKMESLCLIAYHPFASEVKVLKILSDMKLKKIYVPRIRGNGLLFQSLETNEFITHDKATLIIVPALFVRKDGHRLGRGGGYYDRLLRFCVHSRKIFLGYHWQIRDQIPVEKHDQRVSSLITEEGITNCWQYIRQEKA